MYKCICHAVTDGDVDRYHLIGTKCGKCLECPMGKKMLKKFKKKNKKLIRYCNDTSYGKMHRL